MIAQRCRAKAFFTDASRMVQHEYSYNLWPNFWTRDNAATELAVAAPPVPRRHLCCRVSPVCRSRSTVRCPVAVTPPFLLYCELNFFSSESIAVKHLVPYSWFCSFGPFATTNFCTRLRCRPSVLGSATQAVFCTSTHVCSRPSVLLSARPCSRSFAGCTYFIRRVNGRPRVVQVRDRCSRPVAPLRVSRPLCVTDQPHTSLLTRSASLIRKDRAFAAAVIRSYTRFFDCLWLLLFFVIILILLLSADRFVIVHSLLTLVRKVYYVYLQKRLDKVLLFYYLKSGLFYPY